MQMYLESRQELKWGEAILKYQKIQHPTASIWREFVKDGFGQHLIRATDGHD